MDKLEIYFSDLTPRGAKAGAGPLWVSDRS